MNIVYLLFGAVYMVSFGVLSYNKIGEKLKGGSENSEANIVIEESHNNTPENAFHLFTDGEAANQVDDKPSVYPPLITLRQEIPPDNHYSRILCVTLYCRPPPSIS